MSAPHLRILPNPTDEAMALLGTTTIADVLGTYEHNIDERDRLLHELLQEDDIGPATRTERGRLLFASWRGAERRLHLYRLLANELEPLP